ncbi:MAG: capsular exopolysaccharide synthesis family protein, partial [Candidatus Omnitrophota bacterium]
EEKLLAIDAELKNLNLTLKDQEPNEISKILASEKWQKNFIFVGLKRRLLEIEFECFLLLIDYTEKHPTVIAKTNEIEEVKRKLISTIKNIPNIRGSIQNNNYLDLANNHIFLNIRSEVLYRIINGFYGDSGSLSGNQLKYVRLKRNIDRLLIAYDKLLIQKQEVKLNLAKVIDDVVTVVSPAITPRHPIKPNARNNYMVSIVVGLLLGLLLCFISESMDSSIGTISDVEDELKLSILGIIPYMSKEEVLMGETLEVTTPKDKKLELQKRRLVTISNPKSWAAESIKMLRTNLVQLLKTNNKKTILFTSSDKQEGKSTLVTNMALSLAQLGMKTVLVGCNLRRPTLYKIFGLTRAPGVSDILMGNIDWRNTVRTSTDILTGGLNIDHLLQMPGIDNLNIIPCGIPVDNISEILNSTALDTLLAELKENYDAVIIDCSPVMAVPDAITLCNKVDGVVLVYKVGHTPKDILARCKSNLLNANANIFGIVLNAMRSQTQLGYSAYYYRYYADTPDEKNNLFSKLKKKLTGTQDAENLS